MELAASATPAAGGSAVERDRKPIRCRAIEEGLSPAGKEVWKGSDPAIGIRVRLAGGRSGRACAPPDPA